MYAYHVVCFDVCGVFVVVDCGLLILFGCVRCIPVRFVMREV